MKAILNGTSIVKSYGTGMEKQKVLDEVSIAIKPGEFVSVMGPSGSGKSTLLYTLSGMEKMESGQVSFGGRNLMEMSEKELADLRRTGMGFVFQQPTMLKNLNILDNIILPAMGGKQKNREEIVRTAHQLMERTGINALATRNITQVSGGQLQRAGICRALMNKPQIIFGDEPTGALNSKSAQEIIDILCGINHTGTTILLVTHDAKVAASTERVLFMRDGIIESELCLGKYTGEEMEERNRKVMDQMKAIGI